MLGEHNVLHSFQPVWGCEDCRRLAGTVRSCDQLLPQPSNGEGFQLCKVSSFREGHIGCAVCRRRQDPHAVEKPASKLAALRTGWIGWYKAVSDRECTQAMKSEVELSSALVVLLADAAGSA